MVILRNIYFSITYKVYVVVFTLWLGLGQYHDLIDILHQ